MGALTALLRLAQPRRAAVVARGERLVVLRDALAEAAPKASLAVWDVDRCFRQQLGTCAPALSGQELEWIVALDSVPELLATPDLLAAEGTVVVQREALPSPHPDGWDCVLLGTLAVLQRSRQPRLS